MMRYLLDTNVISELMNPVPNSSVLEFLTQLEESYLSVITLHELYYGVALLPDGQRKRAFLTRLTHLQQEYAEAILPLTPVETLRAAALRAQAKQQGNIVHLADALIASTADVHHLIVATRNVKDFIPLGIAVVNPWEVV